MRDRNCISIPPPAIFLFRDFDRRFQVRTFAVLVLSLGLIIPTYARSKSKSTEYKGKVYQEIRIDDKGIFLVDSLGNETEISVGDESEGESHIPEPPVQIPPLNVTIDIPPGLYTDTIDAINRIGGSVTIDPNVYVLGDVTVVGGNATIKGRVGGSITSTGKVHVASSGIVEGNVTGSKVIEDPDSRVLGRVSEQDYIGFPLPQRDWANRGVSETGLSAFVLFVWLILQLGITLGIALLFRKPTDRIKEAFHANIFKMLMVGFLTEIFLLPVVIVLIITIIGIPIALIALPLGLVAAALMGLAAFCLFISDFVKTKEGGVEPSRLMKVVIGFVILQVPTMGIVLGLMIGSPAMWIVFTIIASLLFFIVMTASFGAALLTRFGSRDYRGSKITARVSGGHFTATTERAIDENVRKVNARIGLGAGQFDIVAAKSAPGLVAELIGGCDCEKSSYSYAFTPSGEVADLNFSTAMRSNNISDVQGGANDWKICFSPDIELNLDLDIGAARTIGDFANLALARLDLDVGAADARFDFSSLNKMALKTFKVDAGACKLQIVNIGNSRFEKLEFSGGVGKFLLDFSGEFNYRAEARISVGMGAITIELPSKIGVRLRADRHWLNSIDFSKHKLVWVAGQEGVYQTENFDSAAGQLELTLDVGMGSANLEFR